MLACPRSPRPRRCGLRPYSGPRAWCRLRGCGLRSPWGSPPEAVPRNCPLLRGTTWITQGAEFIQSGIVRPGASDISPARCCKRKPLAHQGAGPRRAGRRENRARPPVGVDRTSGAPVAPTARAVALGGSPASFDWTRFPDGLLPREALEPSHRHVAIRSEEHTSELQSQSNLVCRLLLEKKKKKTYK